MEKKLEKITPKEKIDVIGVPSLLNAPSCHMMAYTCKSWKMPDLWIRRRKICDQWLNVAKKNMIGSRWSLNESMFANRFDRETLMRE